MTDPSQPDLSTEPACATPRHSPHEPARSSSAETTGNCAQPQPRRAYHGPTLRHLGSVRELTLGATGFLADAGATKRQM